MGSRITRLDVHYASKAPGIDIRELASLCPGIVVPWWGTRFTICQLCHIFFRSGKFNHLRLPSDLWFTAVQPSPLFPPDVLQVAPRELLRPFVRLGGCAEDGPVAESAAPGVL